MKTLRFLTLSVLYVADADCNSALLSIERQPDELLAHFAAVHNERFGSGGVKVL